LEEGCLANEERGLGGIAATHTGFTLKSKISEGKQLEKQTVIGKFVKKLTILFSVVLLRMSEYGELLSLKYITIQLKCFINANKSIKLMPHEFCDCYQLRRRAHDVVHFVSNSFFKNSLYF
jgi:hypothetical protein